MAFRVETLRDHVTTDSFTISPCLPTCWGAFETANRMLKRHHPIRVGFLILPILTTHFLSHAASAAVTVDPAQTITHRVMVQPIRVSKTDGSTANFMGTPSSESYMKEQINRIWAQVGIEIVWLDLVDHINDFVYDGSPANYTSVSRPTSHLNSIINSSSTPPLSADPKTLNLFFVRIPAGFKRLADNYAAGLAYVDSNGSTIYVGSSLLTYNNGRDAAASVIAHEIGHNLGLSHFQSSGSNLMYSGSGNGEKLVSSQQNTVFTDNFGTDSFDFVQAITSEPKYLEWVAFYNVIEGPTGDDDRDNLSNAFEFLNGSSPKDFTPHPSSTMTSQGLVWNLNKTPDAVADGFSYLAESSLNLGSWLPAGASGSGSDVLTDNANSFSVLLKAGYPSAFIRFDVDIPESLNISSPITAAQLLQVGPAQKPQISNCGVDGCGFGTAQH